MRLKLNNFLGEEFYSPNGKQLFPKFKKSEFGLFKKEKRISPK